MFMTHFHSNFTEQYFELLFWLQIFLCVILWFLLPQPTSSSMAVTPQGPVLFIHILQCFQLTGFILPSIQCIQKLV